jgi:glucokinase
MANYTIGVDLGGTNLRVAAVDEQGHLLEKITLGTQLSLGRDHVIHDMCESIQQLTQKYSASSKLLGIGIGVPGIIDVETGMVREATNLPGWANFPVRSEIEQRLHTHVVLGNDSKVATLGEKWLGAGRAVDDMAMLTLGTGVGGGLILGGKIWYGMDGMAGEFGHWSVEPEGHPCGCGNRGCLEQYASATAVVRMAREAIASGKAPVLAQAASTDTEFSSRVIYNLAIQGDGEARRIFHRVGRALGIALSALVNGLNLPMYVLGGGAASAWDAFAPSMFEELRARSIVYRITTPTQPIEGSDGASEQVETSDLERKTIITRALLGSDAGLFGAARLPMIVEK